jgi:hypothetical protein
VVGRFEECGVLRAKAPLPSSIEEEPELKRRQLGDAVAILAFCFLTAKKFKEVLQERSSTSSPAQIRPRGDRDSAMVEVRPQGGTGTNRSR